MDETKIARRREAGKIVTNYMGWSTGAAFLPVPYLDLAAVTGLQIKMVADLAEVYEIPFSRNAVKTIIAGLCGSILPATLARATSSFIKAIPGIGALLGAITAPAFASASTYAIGKLFVTHFEAGGGIDDFDIEGSKEEFQKEFEEAVDSAASKKKAATASTA